MNEEKKGQIRFVNSGNAYVKLDESNEIFIYKKNTLNSLHLDIVKISLIEKDGKIEGVVTDIISRFKTQFVGTVHKYKDSTFVILDGTKYPSDFYIPKGFDIKAKDKQKVIVELKRWEPKSKPLGVITKILGKVGNNDTEMNSIMYEYELPIDFPKDVEDEASLISSNISNEEISKRKDLRNTTIIGIDPIDSKDADDTIGIEFIDGSYIISVNIADVTHYVKPDSLIDREASLRSTSVYLVDRCIPMLPKILSNGICSLKSGNDKLSFSAIFKIDNNGTIIDRWFGKTIINVKKDYSYEEAQLVIEKGVRKENKNTDEAILKLNDIAKKIRLKRTGSLKMDGLEVKFKLNKDGKPTDVYFKTQKESNNLIEEFMLLANQEVSILLSKNKHNSIYRIHDTPNEDKLKDLKNLCNNFGYSLDISKENVKSSLNKLLSEVKGKSEENMISSLVSRCMDKAKYTSNNIGHYGLGFKYYTHFTSPIRRYADIICHRELEQKLENKSHHNSSLEQMCDHINKKELSSSKAQRDSIKYKQAEYLQDKIGNIYEGIISNITDWGVYIEISENKCEGLLKTEYYKADLKNYKATLDNRKVQLGDKIMVKIKSVNLERKTVDLSI